MPKGFCACNGDVQSDTNTSFVGRVSLLVGYRTLCFAVTTLDNLHCMFVSLCNECFIHIIHICLNFTNYFKGCCSG